MQKTDRVGADSNHHLDKLGRELRVGRPIEVRRRALATRQLPPDLVLEDDHISARQSLEQRQDAVARDQMLHGWRVLHNLLGALEHVLFVGRFVVVLPFPLV